MQTEGPISATPTIVGRGGDEAGAALELLVGAEAIEAADGRQPAIDGIRLRIVSSLRGNEVDELGGGERVERLVSLAEPAIENDQVEGVGANGVRGDTPDFEGSQETAGVGQRRVALEHLEASVDELHPNRVAPTTHHRRRLSSS